VLLGVVDVVDVLGDEVIDDDAEEEAGSSITHVSKSI